VILLDTDICIEILRGNQRVIERREKYLGEMAISFVTVAELYYGVENSQNPTENRVLVDRFILGTLIVHSDLSILKRFGELKSRLKKRNILIPDADLFIGATSLEKSEALVTGNARHFERIEGLTIKNWIK
jgi:tRNA(fMet)-specific endonuclease VapC